MTIAACYVSPEGIVLGADSTTTYNAGTGPHYYNNSQKLFEIGEGGTLAVVTWGLGGLAFSSYRRLFAQLSDELVSNSVESVQAVAERWVDLFWSEYTGSQFLREFKALAGKAPYNPATAIPSPNTRTREEEEVFNTAKISLVVGFCIGGYVKADRTPGAYVTIFSPDAVNKPVPIRASEGFNFWGAPNMIQRLIFRYDANLRENLLLSGKWSGSPDDLDQLLQQFSLQHPFTLPIRDAVDFVYSCIYSTIKALKFSNLSRICGGPIEIAVITADRPFRWVCHKAWDSAIREGHYESQHRVE